VLRVRGRQALDIEAGDQILRGETALLEPDAEHRRRQDATRFDGIGCRHRAVVTRAHRA
jgi:hypothetical protein